MKKILFCLAAFACLFFVVWCSKDGEERTPPAPIANQHTLTYTAGANGSIDGASQQTVIRGGTGSMVRAVPANGYHFVSWSDGLVTVSRTDANVTADLAVTAEFAANQHTLHYMAEENGTIQGASQQTVDDGGAGSTVTAVPAEGYHFVSWSDGVTTASRTDSEVTADLKVTPSFALNQYIITYTAGEYGVIEGDNPQTVSHGGDGSPVTAVPAEDHYFVSWSDGLTTASRAEQKVTADLTVTAGFALNQYTLTYAAGENGFIGGDKLQKIEHGSAGSTVTAVPADGHHFVGWSDGVATASRTDSGVTSDLAVTASFAANRYELTYTAGENGTIAGVSQQLVELGGDATPVTAVADNGYSFVTWSDGVTTAKRIDTKITGELTVSAIFEINTFSIGGSVSGLVNGTRLILQNNARDDLAITANGDFIFATELLDAAAYEVRVSTQPTSPNQICQVTSGTGTIAGEIIDDIVVTCAPVSYQIGGKVSGLPAGYRVVLRNNERDDLELSGDGDFAFITPLDDGSPYEVEVFEQPRKPNWTCAVENAAGALKGMAVTNVIVDCYPEAVLQARPGIGKATLSWNSDDFSEVLFDLCRAQEEIPPGSFSGCRELKGSVLEKKVQSPLTVSKLTNNIPYWFQLEARYASGRQTFSEVVVARPFGGLNDTGIDWCANNDANRSSTGTRLEKSESCEALAATHPGQDAFFGRDALARARKLKKTGNGESGFDFTKLCLSGEAPGEGKCPPNPLPGTGPNNWACTRDNVTGLIWEVKTDSGLRSQSNTYSWYNQDETFNGGEPGLKNGGKCEGSDCDTRAFIQAVNEQGLCGARDWRLPTKRELLSIVDNSRSNPAIDTAFFPNSPASYYWSSSPMSDQDNSAWQVYFSYGEASPNKKNQSNRVRLVRGRILTFGLNNPN